MQQTLKIDAATARREYPGASPVIKMVFEQSFPTGFFSEKLTDRINSMSDVFAECGIDEDEFYEECQNLGLPEDEIGYREAKLICKAFNGDWVPNWDNSNERKWRPWFYMDGPSGFRFLGSDCDLTISGVGSRLCFKEESHCDHAAKAFLHIYKKFFTA